MLFSDLAYIFSIWFTTLVVGLLSWPVSQKLFHRLSDKGYTIAKLLGFLVISYAVFTLATFNIIPLTLEAILAVTLAWGLLNLWLWKKHQPAFKANFNWKSILSVEGLFLLLLIFWAGVRSHQPEIYGIERFMDFGFIQSLFNTQTLPLFDMWFLGEPVNYYYFGHFVGFIALALSSIDPVPGFMVLSAWVFAMVGVNVYRLGADLFRQFRLSRRSVQFQRWTRFVSGWLSVWLTHIAGAWHSTLWLVDQLKFMMFGGEVPSFWYAEPSRIIPGTITEPGIYSYLVAEGHAHVWGLFNGIFVLTALLAMLLQPQKRLRPPLQSGYFWAVCVAIGLAFMTNSLDVISLGGVTGLVMLVKYRRHLKQLLLGYLVLPIAAYVVALPWRLHIEVPLTGIGIVKAPSPILEWFFYWGAWLLLALMFLVGVLVYALFKRYHSEPRLTFHMVVILSCAFILAMLEIFYMKDILTGGEWYRANTVFKFSTQIWLWLGAVGGSMMVWLALFPKRWWSKTVNIVLLILIFAGPAFYAPIILEQGAVGNRPITGLASGLGWWQNNLPHDYEAYEFLRDLRNGLPEHDKIRHIMEAEGESYTNSDRFSTILGWPTPIGWPGHEWTWRGTHIEVAERRSDVKKFYIDDDDELASDVLKKYGIDYVVVGEVEYTLYGEDIKLDRILAAGDVVFANDKTLIVQVQHRGSF